MDILFAYKTMPEWHKENLKNYLIYDGIYTCFPDIAEEDARFIFKVCNKVDNENINPFSIAHYITDYFTRGNLSKNDLEKATSGEICEAVYFDSLNYFHLKSDEMEEEK